MLVLYMSVICVSVAYDDYDTTTWIYYAVYRQSAQYKMSWPTPRVSNYSTPFANYTVLYPRGFIISCPVWPGIVGVVLKWLPLMYRATSKIKQTGGPLENNGTHWVYKEPNYKVEGNYLQYYTLLFNCSHSNGSYEIVPRTFEQNIDEFEDTAIYKNPVSQLENGTSPPWLAW